MPGCFTALLTATRGSVELQSKTMDSVTVQIIATAGSEVLLCEMVKEVGSTVYRHRRQW